MLTFTSYHATQPYFDIMLISGHNLQAVQTETFIVQTSESDIHSAKPEMPSALSSSAKRAKLKRHSAICVEVGRVCAIFVCLKCQIKFLVA